MFADQAQEGDKADGSRSDVVMSGVVDSRRVGHDNIDANGTLKKLSQRPRIGRDRGQSGLVMLDIIMMVALNLSIVTHS